MEDPKAGPIIGIDLGTTNSVVAAVIDGRPQVLTDASGEKILPSVVGMDPGGKLICGTAARRQQVAFPERTITSVKRRMGSMESISLGEESLTPPEISAIILGQLRDRAAATLGTEVTRAVVTVPAFFDENQRQATREAGELAGLKIERIINEPTAATLVYHVGSERRQNIVVYDFGGGTFDVSVVRIESGVVEVLSSKGDTQLGGDDLDNKLLKHVADTFLDEHDVDLRKDAGTRWRLLRACEQAKCQLSHDAAVTIAEEFIAESDGKPLNLQLEVERSEYEDLIEPLIDKTIECVDQALRDAKLTVKDIDDLVLVGGSTRTPLVQQRLREEFDLEPSRAVDPDLAVAIGAATQAAMIAGQSVGPVLVDVTGHTLGIEAMVGITFSGPQLEFSPIIHRNSPLPASHVRAYSKAYDDQTKAEINVYQGEHTDLSRNRQIGTFDLDLESGGGHKNRIEVSFDLTLDGTLEVTAKQVATGKQQKLRIDNALTKFREEDRERARQRLAELVTRSEATATVEGTVQSRTQWDRHDSAETAPSPPQAPEKATRLLEKAKRLKGKATEEDAEEIAELESRLQDAVEQNEQGTIDEICTELDDVLFYVE